VYFYTAAPKDDMVRVNLTTDNMRSYFFIGAEIVDQDKNGYVTILLNNELFISETQLPKNFSKLYESEQETWRVEE
jgi:hypothetical protein